MSIPLEQIGMNIGARGSAGFRAAQDTANINEIINRVSSAETAEEKQNIMGQILSQVSPERQPQAVRYIQDQIDTARKKQLKTDRVSSLVAAGFPAEFADLPDSVLTQIIKAQQGGDKMDPLQLNFQKQMITEGNEKIRTANQYRPVLDTVDRMKELSKVFQGVSGFAKARTPGHPAWSAANEFDKLGTTIMEPVFKLYNPSGALANQKVMMLRNDLMPKWNDTQPMIDAKLNAIRKLAEYKVQEGNRVGKLFQKSKGGRLDPEEFYQTQEEDDILIQVANEFEKAKENIDKEKKSEKVEAKAEKGKSEIEKDKIYEQVMSAP